MTDQDLGLSVDVDTSNILKLCDDNAGTITEFIRKYNAGTYADYELDGVTPYVVTGEIVQCNFGTWIETLCDSVNGVVDVSNTPGVAMTVNTWDFIYDFKFSPDLTVTLTRTAGATNQFGVSTIDGQWNGLTGAGSGNATYLLTFATPYTGILELSASTIDSGETYGSFKIDGVFAYPDVATLESTAPNNLIYDQNGTFQWVVDGITTLEVRFYHPTGRGAFKLVLYENVKQSFQRVFKSDPIGNVTSEDLDFDGNPYVPKATVTKCTSQYDEQILCDVILSQASNTAVGQTGANVTTVFNFATDLSIVATISNLNYNTTLATSRDFYKTGAGNTTWAITFSKPLTGQFKLIIVNTGQTFGSVSNFSIPPDESTLVETSPGSGQYTVGTSSGSFTWDAKNITGIQWDEIAGVDAIHYRLYLFLYYNQEFVRHYLLDSEDNLTYFDTDPDGNFYAVLGTPESCNDELTSSETIESYVWDLQPTDVWSAENDVPDGYTLTGVTMIVAYNNNNDNSVTGRNGEIILNVIEGTTMSWNCEDSNTLVGPSFYAGSDGRMFVFATVRRNKI